jgi:TonB family protein
MVAKIYTRSIPGDKLRKLTLMTELAAKSPALLNACAWPVATLHSSYGTGSRGDLQGFLMPKIVGRKEIHHLTSPPTRKRDFLNRGWTFQIHVAQNLAAVIEMIHGMGVVIGDINEKGFLVGQDGTLRIIDCDSFQLSHSGRTFRCEVGVPDYTPPELQGIKGGFGSVVRTMNHDAFGLAVIVFKLLFQGRHPFMGRFVGTGDPDLQRFIREYRFAYGKNSSAKQIGPPPHSLHLGALTHRAALLFEQAFAEPAFAASRPTAAVWYESLRELLASLTTCRANTGHQYLKTLATCPWCTIEKTSGIILFFGKITIQGTGWTLNIAYFSAAAGRIPELAREPFAITQTSIAGSPLPQSLLIRIRKSRSSWYGAAAVAALLGLAVDPVTANHLGGVIGCILALLPLLGRPAPRELWQLIEGLQRSLNDAEARLKQIGHQWDALPPGDYRDERQRLQVELKEYAALDTAYKAGMDDLERRRRELQLLDCLDHYSLRSEGIKGIGAARKATLASWGIHTAADLTRGKLTQIPGFGSTLVTNLLAWRQRKESSFRFDPSKPIDPRELANLMQRLQTKKQALEHSMNRRLTLLNGTAKSIQDQRALLRVQANSIASDLAQADANLAVAKTQLDTPLIRRVKVGLAILASVLAAGYWMYVAPFRYPGPPTDNAGHRTSVPTSASPSESVQEGREGKERGSVTKLTEPGKGGRGDSSPNSAPAGVSKTLAPGGVRRDSPIPGQPMRPDSSSHSFHSGHYVRLLHAKIGERWATRTDTGLSVDVTFEIGRDGFLTKEPLAFRSSGDPKFDLDAVRAIVRASPFPPLPPDYEPPMLRIHARFTDVSMEMTAAF